MVHKDQATPVSAYGCDFEFQSPFVGMLSVHFVAEMVRQGNGVHCPAGLVRPWSSVGQQMHFAEQFRVVQSRLIGGTEVQPTAPSIGLTSAVSAAAEYAQGTGGRVIFITSLAENVTGPQQVDYGASKGGMRMTMVGFATALGKHGITCNAVVPGMILTDMTRFHWEQPENAEFIKNRVPVGRIGEPADIGNAVAFLASMEAEYISGITLRVDGGHQACCV
jgi:NAD(P)-dependent dehydrogenase (short-subunit alcohol dehydrogenase family)